MRHGYLINSTTSNFHMITFEVIILDRSSRATDSTFNSEAFVRHACTLTIIFGLDMAYIRGHGDNNYRYEAVSGLCLPSRFYRCSCYRGKAAGQLRLPARRR